MVKIKIHRGAREIGGSCVEIAADEHRIILDLGLPLQDAGEEKPDWKTQTGPRVSEMPLPDIEGLYGGQVPSVEGVVLSHAHQDHSGLLNSVHQSIPVYMSRESELLLDTGNIFHVFEQEERGTPGRRVLFKHWRPFEIGPFRITSFLMDHSAFGSSAFLIEKGGKRVHCVCGSPPIQQQD